MRNWEVVMEISNIDEKFQKYLLDWWSVNKRHFDWRYTSIPYEILIAEMLLRKTTAKQVSRVYKSLLQLCPNPKSLHEASSDQLEKILTPLGMQHKRAILLKEIGSILVTKFNQEVPNSQSDLMSLPGVGLYIANAVLCFAFGKDMPIVDTNIIRVFGRVFSFQSKKRRPKDDLELWTFVGKFIPQGKCREFNLAIIDLAHLICTPNDPSCKICPLKIICRYATDNKRV